MPSSIKYYSFKIRGLDFDACRMILHHAKVTHDEHFFSREEWSQVKSSTPMGCVPIIELEGKQYTQWIAMARYLGREYGLMAASPEANMRIDGIVDAVKQIIWYKVRPVMMMAAGDDKKKAETELCGNWKDIFTFVEKQIGPSNSGYLCGSQPTWADFALLVMWRVLEHSYKLDFAEQPNIKKHFQNMMASESIKSYMEKTKDIPMF